MINAYCTTSDPSSGDVRVDIVWTLDSDMTRAVRSAVASTQVLKTCMTWSTNGSHGTNVVVLIGYFI